MPTVRPKADATYAVTIGPYVASGAGRTFGTGFYITSLAGELQVVDGQLNVGRFPGCVELLSDGGRVGGFVLRLEASPQPEQRTPVAGIELEVLTEHSLGLCRLVVLEQRGAERFPHRVVPRGRLVVREPVLSLDRTLPVCNRRPTIAFCRRDARIDDGGGDVEDGAGVVEHSERHVTWNSGNGLTERLLLAPGACRILRR